MIRFVLLFLVLYGTAANAGALPKSCENPPFEAGETARFSARIGPLKVGEGTGTLERATNLPEGILAGATRWNPSWWIARGRIISTGLTALFYSVDDAIETWISSESLLPAFRELRIRETNEQTDRRVTFDHELGKAFFWRHRSIYRKKPEKEGLTIRENPMAPGSFEPISLFLYLRCLPFASHGVIEIPVHEDRKNLIVAIQPESVETLATIFGPREALRARIHVFHEGKVKFERPFVVWVSNDEQRLPLRFVADLRFANLTGELVGYRKNKTSKITGELDPTFLPGGHSAP